MPAERVAMRHVREIIRLKFSVSLPTRDIARRLGVAPSTVRETLKRFEGSGLSWPLPDGMMDAALEEALYANRRSKRGHRRHPEPDWPTVHRELKRKHVTLLIVWDEYIAANPGGIHLCRANRSISAAYRPRDLQRETAARALGHLLGQAASATALRHSLLRDAGGVRKRSIPDLTTVRARHHGAANGDAPARESGTPIT